MRTHLRQHAAIAPHGRAATHFDIGPPKAGARSRSSAAGDVGSASGKGRRTWRAPPWAWHLRVRAAQRRAEGALEAPVCVGGRRGRGPQQRSATEGFRKETQNRRGRRLIRGDRARRRPSFAKRVAQLWEALSGAVRRVVNFNDISGLRGLSPLGYLPPPCGCAGLYQGVPKGAWTGAGQEHAREDRAC